MSTQTYFNVKTQEGTADWFLLFIRQLPSWYLMALLTPVVMFFYDKYPLDIKKWKRNLGIHILIALGILLFFSNLRLIVMYYVIFERDVFALTQAQYATAFLSQMAWDVGAYAFIIAVIFADKANTNRRQNELYATKVELSNKELQNQLNQAQLEALKLQLSPHFLFNTLNTVSSLIRSEDYSTAIQVNAKLGDFLRTTLQADSTQFVTFEKELHYLDLYLSIESLRFGDRLKIEKQIEKECNGFEVPYFILQPIIENAIKHGIAKQGQASLILITACVKNDALNVSIFNEGKLLPENWKIEENWGIGLSNVNSRLKKIYGVNFLFSIKNYPERNGVEVALKIPTSSNPELQTPKLFT